MILQEGTVNAAGVLRDRFLSFRGKRRRERPMRLQLPSPCHPAAQGSEKPLGGDPAGSHQSTLPPQFKSKTFDLLTFLPLDSFYPEITERCGSPRNCRPKLASTLLTASWAQSHNIVNFMQPHATFGIVCVCPWCIHSFSTTAWKSCWAGRTTRAAPPSTTPADWASTTRWRTCWVSPGRTACRASLRTRSQRCTLLLSESNRWPPNDNGDLCKKILF